MGRGYQRRNPYFQFIVNNYLSFKPAPRNLRIPRSVLGINRDILFLPRIRPLVFVQVFSLLEQIQLFSYPLLHLNQETFDAGLPSSILDDPEKNNLGKGEVMNAVPDRVNVQIGAFGSNENT